MAYYPLFSESRKLRRKLFLSVGLWVISEIIANYYPCADPENRDSNWQFFIYSPNCEVEEGPDWTRFEIIDKSYPCFDFENRDMR